MTTTGKRTRPSLPGEILAELYLVPHEISFAKLAAACGVSAKHVSELVHGQVGVTAQMALRLATVLGTDPEIWLDCQRAIDVYNARQRIAKSGKRPRPLAEFAADRGGQ
jgi:addiction module HigA family antidote